MQKTAEVSAVAFHGVTGRLFWAVYTGTRPVFPCHQGGEGVAGTPGACSQVFCHPIRCIARTRQDRLAVALSHLNHTHHLRSHFGSSRIDILPDFGLAWPVSCERFFQASSFIRVLLGLCVLLRNDEAPCDQVGG